MSKKSDRMVTRKVVVSRRFKVYSMDNGTLTELGEIECKGRPSTRELAKEYNVLHVVCEPITENVLRYGMSVEEFMKHATAIEETENKANADAE